MSQGKLTDEHVEAILYRTVLGLGPTEIAHELAEGISTRSGQSLAAVEVGESTVRYHAGNNRARIEELRRDLYGGAYTNPLAWPGERLRRLEKLWSQGVEELDRLKADESTPLDRSRVRRELRGIISEADRVMQQVDPDLTVTTDLGNGTTARAKGKPDREALKHLAGKLKQAIEVGAIDLDELDSSNGGAQADG